MKSAATERRIDARTVEGVHAAIVCPLTLECAVDEAVLAGLVERLAATPGLRGFLVNGHAGENAVMDRATKERVLAIVRSAAAGSILIAGVNAEGSRAAAAEAEDAAAAGADAVMVFAPNGWALGQPPGAALIHHRTVAAATGLPMLLFQAVAGSGAAYAPDVLEQLLGLPPVIGIKEGSWDTAAYEATRRLCKSVRPEVAVLASGDEHLWPSFILGSEGSIVSLATLIPEPIIALEAAVRRGDMAAAAEAHARIYPLARAIYARPPGVMAAARIKTCLRLMGVLRSDTTYPPLGPLDPGEVEDLRTAMRAAGLL